jgi:hypothetical protein
MSFQQECTYLLPVEMVKTKRREKSRVKAAAYADTPV